MNKGIDWLRIKYLEDLPPLDTVCVAKHKLDGNITCKATKTGFFGVNDVDYDYNEFLCYYVVNDYIEKLRKQSMLSPSMLGREEDVNKGTELTSDHIFSIVEKLIGRITPSGCSNADIKHLENLKVFIEVADKINEHISYCANFKDSHEFSVKQIGILAEKYRERINVDI